MPDSRPRRYRARLVHYVFFADTSERSSPRERKVRHLSLLPLTVVFSEGVRVDRAQITATLRLPSHLSRSGNREGKNNAERYD